MENDKSIITVNQAFQTSEAVSPSETVTSNVVEVSKELTFENVADFLDTEEGKRMIQPLLDRHFDRSLSTWKERTLPKLIQEEQEKRNDPKAIQVRELQEELEREDRMNHISEQIRQHKKLLPTELVSILADVDTEKSGWLIDQLVESITETMPVLVRLELDQRLNNRGTSK